jgi:hypothetical protein
LNPGPKRGMGERRFPPSGPPRAAERHSGGARTE